MGQSRNDAGPMTSDVVSFDDALLDACPAAVRADLLEEAALLMQAFAPEGRPEELAAMARTLSVGLRNGKHGERMRGRRLAAALRRLAKSAAD